MARPVGNEDRVAENDDAVRRRFVNDRLQHLLHVGIDQHHQIAVGDGLHQVGHPRECATLAM
jgi:hypothetical protein